MKETGKIKINNNTKQQITEEETEKKKKKNPKQRQYEKNKGHNNYSCTLLVNYIITQYDLH